MVHDSGAPTPTRLDEPTTAPALYAQDGQGYEAIVHAHYFIGGHDWLVTEYDPIERIAFGWACLNGDRQNAELGYVSLDELDAIQAPIRGRAIGPDAGPGLVTLGYARVERDTDWPEGLSLTQAISELDRRQGR